MLHTLNGIFGSKAAGDLATGSDGLAIPDDTHVAVQSSDDEAALRLTASGALVTTAAAGVAHGTAITTTDLVLVAPPTGAAVEVGMAVAATNIPAGTTVRRGETPYFSNTRTSPPP